MARGYKYQPSGKGAGHARYKYKYKYKNKKKSKLADSAINTATEKAIVRIHEKLEQDESWQTSRVEHMASGATFPNTHARPTFNNFVELQANTIWMQDLTQLPTDSTDNLQESKIGKYSIKTIQSRLRFYSKDREDTTDDCPTCIRVALIKINNSGRKSLIVGGSDVNQDIWPTATMIGDTNLRYSGIHKKDLQKTLPYDQKAVVIAQKKFWLGTNKPTNGGRADGANSTNSTASTIKEITLTKTYKNPIIHYQVAQQLSVDDILTQDQNRSKILGDRVWLCILSDNQLAFAFYGVSGCIYNYSEIEGLPSVPLPESAEILGGQNN